MHLRTRACRRLALRVCALAVCAVAGTGCVRREIEVTSTPPGALLTLNGREMGRTPVTVDFTFDGTYDVRLRLDGYDPVVGSGQTHAPVWDFVGADLVAEVFPAELHRVDRWHFDLLPAAQAEVGLMDRANAARAAAKAMPSAAPVTDAPAPVATPERATPASR
jgi:hypothetical protein